MRGAVRRRMGTGIPLILAGLALSPGALAEQYGFIEDHEAPAPRPNAKAGSNGAADAKAVASHDAGDFFFRADTGFGSFSHRAVVPVPTYAEDSTSIFRPSVVSLQGAGFPIHLTLGFGVGGGVALGVSGFYVATEGESSDSYESLGSSSDSSSSYAVGWTKADMTYALIGPTLTWYPMRHAGLNFELAIGYGWSDVEASGQEAIVSTGVGASLAIGYDWAVSDRVALGALIRLVGGRVSITDSDPDLAETRTLSAPAVAFSVTYF